MKDTSQIKRQFDELFDSLRQRRRNAEEIRVRATKETEDAVKEIGIVDAAFLALKPVQSFYNLAALIDEQTAKTKTKVEPGHNRAAIAEIINAGEGPMRAANIALVAHQTGKIKSESGYKGVYATVSTVLSRNRKHFFIQTGDHKWDLRERKIRALTSAPPPSKSRALDMALSQIEKQFGPTRVPKVGS